MYLFFDLETTGLPKNWKAPVHDLDNWPRMIQIAWILSDKNAKKIKSDSFIIKPEGFNISEEAARVHGITTQKAEQEGEDLKKILQIFTKLIDESEYIVAHNINFDENILLAEMLRKNINNNFHKKNKICTMRASTNYCQIPGIYGYKWPQLGELHQILFGEDFAGAHDASCDINATERCFWELVNRSVI